MYAVVKFLDEHDAPGIVSLNWILDERTCMYPSVRTNEARHRLLKQNAEPANDWSQCKIQILHQYNNFRSAVYHLQQAEETFNLDSDEEIFSTKVRKRKKSNMLIYPGEESDDSSSLISKKIKSNHCRIPYAMPPTKESCNFSPSVHPESPSPPRVEKITSQYHQSNKLTASSSTSMMNGKIVAWMAEISQQIKQLQEQVALILENQKSQKQHQVLESDEDQESLSNLPVTDYNGFLHLNKRISEESHFRNLLIKVLISVGGKDIRCLVHNILRRVLTDEVAELFSLSGKSTAKNLTKKRFFGTELSRVIFSVCQRVFKDSATEVNVKEATGKWLHQAKFRKMRRMQRQEKNGESEGFLD